VSASPKCEVFDMLTILQGERLCRRAFHLTLNILPRSTTKISEHVLAPVRYCGSST
jgi:hypothetical protein